ncbi:MAG: hypothetical protein ACKOBP_08810, partial [Planctomycetia bacterium]
MIATSRLSFSSRARYTRPIAPWPSRPTTVYPPIEAGSGSSAPGGTAAFIPPAVLSVVSASDSSAVCVSWAAERITNEQNGSPRSMQE